MSTQTLMMIKVEWVVGKLIWLLAKGALVMIVERKTSFTVSTRVDDKSTQTVTIGLLIPFKDAVLTITADNGKEFAYHKKMTESLQCDVYFADPYCPWQRGLNENTHGLLR
jgi:IS30 family transposase